jgi:hypothetical protein
LGLQGPCISWFSTWRLRITQGNDITRQTTHPHIPALYIYWASKYDISLALLPLRNCHHAEKFCWISIFPRCNGWEKIGRELLIKCSLLIPHIWKQVERVAIASLNSQLNYDISACRTWNFWLTMLGTFLVYSTKLSLWNAPCSFVRLKAGKWLICLGSHDKSLGKERLSSLCYANVKLYTWFYLRRSSSVWNAHFHNGRPVGGIALLCLFSISISLISEQIPEMVKPSRRIITRFCEISLL